MKFPCTISRVEGGRWTIYHTGRDVGELQVTADSREVAIEKMRGELRYRLELCPCSGETYQHVDVEIIEQARR